MNSPRQLALDLIRPLTPTFDNFVVGRNAEALAALRALPGARERLIYLWGERGSGRSHLLQAVAAQGGHLVAGGSDAPLPTFDPRVAGYVIDDVDQSNPTYQQHLFALYNDIRAAERTFLVVAGNQPPATLPLRDDLRTRLAWGLVYQLHALTDDDKAHALLAHARSRGLTLSADVIAYLLTHMPRDMRTLMAILDALDGYALATKRAITVPLVREWAQQAAA